MTVRTARTRQRWLKAAAVLALSLILSACGNAPQSAIDPQGPFAQKPDDLFRIVFAIAVVVFVLVQGLIIYTMVKFRQKPDDDGTLPPQTHGNTKLEILWTAIPALILAVIAVPTVQMIFELDAEPEGAVQVEVIGHRWWWEYRYDFGGETVYTANELAIPAGVPVRLSMRSEENNSVENAVIHSFWIPPLAGKMDVVPGRVTTLNIMADEPGYYLGQCAEYCGLSHANMRLRVNALSASDWQAWVDNQLAPANVPTDGTLEARGREVFYQGACVGCHAINDGEPFLRADGSEVVAAGRTGPDLTHLASRQEFAGAIFELNAETLAAWLENPPAMKPMRPNESPAIGMPNLNLTPDEVEALVAYLLSLT